MEIQWFEISMVYLFVWWLVFFMALPFGVKRSETTDAGHSTGAPETTHLGRKALITTVLAAFLTWGFFVFIQSGLVPVRDVIQ